jgi:cytidylate kinase
VLITVSNQYGSGALHIAQTAAERLGYEYVDEQLPVVVAKRLNSTPAAVDSAENAGKTMSERMLRALESGTPEVGNAQVRTSDFEAECLREVQEAVREFAAHGNVVIVGRGANAILGRRHDLIRVFMHAPKEWRVRRIAEGHGIDERKAAQELERVDRARGEYMRVYYGIEWGNPENYDLSIDTAHFGAQGSAELIVRAAEVR